MKKLILITMGVCLIAAPAVAFHDMGVAHCNGCHTMHNSQDGVPVDDTPIGNGGNPHLLTDDSPSDVCLNCHATHYGGVLQEPGVPDSQGNLFVEQGGGNFWYLSAANLNDGYGGDQVWGVIPGEEAGHNIVAPGRGMVMDSKLAAAPGGSFPSANLGCTSCHDPHGTDQFRFLYGAGRIVQGSTVFTNDAPDADPIDPPGSLYYASEESNTQHTAYKAGMSGWCANCHGDFHNQWQSTLVHPSGQAITSVSGVAVNYNQYAGTDDLINVAGNDILLASGDYATAYVAQIPIEDPTFTTTSTTGATAGQSQVMCLTCHRAHASAGPDAGRWDFNITLQSEDGQHSGIVSPDQYGDPNQRSLCNKCHIQDRYDHH